MFKCVACRNEVEFKSLGSGKIMCSKCGQTLKGKAPKKGSNNADKAPLFEIAWKDYAPANAPALTPEFKFHPVRRWRFDFAITNGAEKIAIEVDGGNFTKHGGRHATDKDREKRRAAAMCGWRVMPFSPQELKRDPVGCVRDVCAALGIEV
jgi:hypothetical protein